ncbi:unnamed protein product [Closterium sp. NIES-64]|nr:unnamed protein product [Closterium sp. NIES-64]
MGVLSLEESDPGSAESTPPPHRHDTRLQAARRREREEQERLERERQELRVLDLLEQQRQHQQQQQQQQPPQQLQQQPPPQPPPQLPLERQLFPPVSGLRALGLSSSPPVFGPTFPPPDASPAVRSFSPPQSPPLVVLDSPTLVTDSRFPPSSASALTAAVAEFAAASRLDYATRVVPAPPYRPLSVGGEFALGCDVLEDRESELEYWAAASPSVCAMLLSPEGDPDALDIPTPRTYREAVSGKWASQWKAAMDSELASWRSTGTYVDAVPPPRANVVDGMWLFKVKRPPGAPPVFKARYVARGFSQREGVDFFQTFAPTPKMTTLRVLLHIAAQRDYELHSLRLLHCVPPGPTARGDLGASSAWLH